MSSYKGIRHARRERNYVFAGLLCIAVSVGILTMTLQAWVLRLPRILDCLG